MLTKLSITFTHVRSITTTDKHLSAQKWQVFDSGFPRPQIQIMMKIIEMVQCTHTLWSTKKVPHLFWTITPMFPGGFSQFFYQSKQQWMLHRAVTKFTTSPPTASPHYLVN